MPEFDSAPKIVTNLGFKSGPKNFGFEFQHISCVNVAFLKKKLTLIRNEMANSHFGTSRFSRFLHKNLPFCRAL